MTPDKSNSGQPDDWGPCPQGELQHMVERIKSQRRRKRIVRISSLSSAFVLIIAVGAFGYLLHLRKQMNDPMVGDALHYGVACNKVRENMVAYVQRDREKPDSDLHGKMFMHIRKCINCRQEERKVQKDLRSKKAAVAANGHWHSPLSGILLATQ